MGLARRIGVPAVVVVALAAFLFLRTFVDARTPILLGGDQGFFWLYGARMLHGDVPYRDFFQFTWPGADVAHLVAFALFGPRVWVTDALIVLLGASIAALVFVVARRIMSEGAAALATCLVVVLVFGEALTTTHHWWSALAVLAAVAAIDDGERETQLAAGGAWVGLAMCCTQTHGGAVLLAFVAFVAVRGGHVARRVAVVVGSCFVSVAAFMAYFVATASPAVVWRCTVAYVLRTVPWSERAWSPGLPEALTWKSLPALLPHLVVYAMLPLAYVVLPRAIAERARSNGDRARPRLQLMWLVGASLLAEVATSLTWVRVFAVAWPGVLLVVCWVDSVAKERRVSVAAGWAGGLAVASLACLLVRSAHRHHPVLVDLPDGERVATEPDKAIELEWLMTHVVPGRSFFATDRPSIYLPLGLESPVYLDAAVPSRQTTAELGARAVRELEAARTEYVLWSTIHEQASGGGAQMQGLRTIAAYVHARYHLAMAFPNGDEAWERD